jgi:hypothetical protein
VTRGRAWRDLLADSPLSPVVSTAVPPTGGKFVSYPLAVVCRISAILRTVVKAIRRFGCLGAILLLQGCGSPDAAVALAQRLDWTTSYAHALLRAAFDQTPVEQDETDRALMREVSDLDRADETLPAEIAEYERARVKGTSDPARRETILSTLDAIGGRYSAVVHTLQRRKTHELVQRVLSETPEMIEELRDRISRLN